METKLTYDTRVVDASLSDRLPELINKRIDELRKEHSEQGPVKLHSVAIGTAGVLLIYEYHTLVQ